MSTVGGAAGAADAAGRVLVLWIPDWPVIAAGLGRPGPMAVMAGPVVLACSPAARAAGVRRRMRLRQAQARCPGLRVVQRDLAGEMRLFEPLVRHLEQTVMPRLEVIRPGLIAVPARGPARYWGGEAELLERVTDAAGEFGHPARAGIADTVFAAALAARRGLVVPAGETAGFLAPYPVGVLGRPRLAELLVRLGTVTVGSFAALPAADVRSRFGAEGESAHRTARGLEARPVVPRSPRGDHTVTREFDPPERLVEPVVFTVKALAGQLHDRLAAAGAVCDRLVVGVELADGRRLSRAFRHEGRLSALAVAERARGVLRSWTDDGDLADRLPAGAVRSDGPAGPDGDGGAAGAGAAAGIVRLTLRPEGLGPAVGQQTALFGEALTPEQVLRAAARLQALLGHRAVTRAEPAGGRGPGDRVRQVPYGDAVERRSPDGPWPGRLPPPHPATVFSRWLPARLTDAAGRPLAVSGRTELSAPPARLAVRGYGTAEVTGWSGPWPVLEEWWDRDRARRMARAQVVTADGHAWLLVIEHGRWWAEASYG